MASSLNKIRNGELVGNGTDRKIILGFKPKKVELLNVTDQVDYCKLQSMVDAKTRKEVAAGDKTYVDAITINADGFTIKASEYVAAKAYHYAAYESQSDC